MGEPDAGRALPATSEDVGAVWSVRARGHRVWFVRGSTGSVEGPFASKERALAGIDPTYAREVIGTGCPTSAVCVEDLDGDAEWGVWLLAMTSDGDRYYIGTPDGPLAGLFTSWQVCREGAIAAKASRSC